MEDAAPNSTGEAHRVDIQTDKTSDQENINPPACPILSRLYGTRCFPKQFFTKDVPVSSMIAACWPTKDAKELLKQSWIPPPPEDGEASGKRVFDPLSAEYLVLPERLAKTKVLQQFNRLKLELKDKEEALAAIKSQRKPNEEEKEKCEAAVTEATEKLQEAQTSFGDLQASFSDDPLALTPWMNALFDTADMGLTTLIVGPGMWPANNAATLFTKADGAEATEGTEKMLAAFRKRYALERGPDTLSVILRVTPNLFREGFSKESVAARVTRLMEVQGLDPEGESPGSLDAVEVGWWDHDAVSPVAVLQQLDKLCEDETETDAETGEVTLKTRKKIKALGVANFAPRAIADAIKSGVSITFAHISCGLHNACAALETLRVCKRYGIKVIADDATMGGCIHEDLVNAPCPRSAAEYPSGVQRNEFAAAVHAMGGWMAVQKALVAVKQIADNHGVSMTAVMLRWQMDLGVTPVVRISWDDPHGALCMVQGKNESKGGAALFQRESFLDEEDMKTLQSLYK